MSNDTTERTIDAPREPGGSHRPAPVGPIASGRWKCREGGALPVYCPGGRPPTVARAARDENRRARPMQPIPLASIPSHYARTQGGDRICLSYPDGSLTWSQLESRANRMARTFAARGVRDGDLTTLALPNGLPFHVACFALWKLGATPHIVSASLPAAELRAIVELAEPRLVVGADRAAVPGGQALAEIDADGHDDAPLPVAVARYWKAMSSGGSTGRPKIIVDRNPAAVDPDDWFLDMPNGGDVLNPGPLYHNAPFIFAHYALFRGNRLVGLARFDALEALRAIEAHRVSWTMMVPTMMHRIWRLPEEERGRFDLSSLDVVGHVASPMPVWLKEKWIEWLGPERVWELYGGTEAVGATWISGSEWLAHKGSVGKCVRGSQVRILDESGGECAPGEIGEVYMLPSGGPESTYHYIGADRRADADGWESLGDMGWLDEDGYLYLADRRGDLILSGGANVYPAEVEAALVEHPGVDSAVAIGLPDEDMGELVHAIVRPSDGWRDRLDEAALRTFVESRLALYKTPRSYEFVGFSLRDDAGKVRRSQLRAERLRAGP